MVRAAPLQICNNDHSGSHLQANRVDAPALSVASHALQILETTRAGSRADATITGRRRSAIAKGVAGMTPAKKLKSASVRPLGVEPRGGPLATVPNLRHGRDCRGSSDRHRLDIGRPLAGALYIGVGIGNIGEINSSQAAAWRKAAIEVFDEDAGRSRSNFIHSRSPERAVAPCSATTDQRVRADNPRAINAARTSSTV